MRRRELIAGLGGAVAWPLAARAQQSMHRVGALLGGDANDAVARSRADEFRKALQRLGWLEGRNVHIEWRWAGNDREQARAYAADLVGLNPEVIFCANTIAISALQRSTTAIPIVFASVTDPIANGFVSSLARPDQNITGFSDREPEMGAKLMQLLKEIAPHVARVAIIVNPPTNAGRLPSSVQRTAIALGTEPVLAEVYDVQGLEEAIVSFARQPDGGVVVPADIFTETHRDLIITLAARFKLPAIYAFRSNAMAGGLLSYGVDQLAEYAGAATYVDRILRGAKVSDLPVQQPVKYELVINLGTARALNLTIPPNILALADEVIE
jgi:putative tryptophan/tyrosine transport system substrate-binding protein